MEYEISRGWTATGDDGSILSIAGFLITVLFAALSAGCISSYGKIKTAIYLQPSMDKERHLPKESYKTAYITFVRRDHLWNFLCNEDCNNSEYLESITNVIICTLWNAVMCLHFCALIQISLIVTVYIWQGLVIAVATFYVILPMILQNLAFLLQLLFKVRSSRFAILEWVIYGRFGQNILYPLNYQLDANIFDSNPIWKAQYVNSAIICIAVLFAAGVFGIWF